MEFADNQALLDLVAGLDNAVEAHCDGFYDQYPSYTDDQINDLAESIGFNEDQPLIDFENYFGFSSLRQQVETAENSWLNNTILDENADPDINCVEDDVVMRALLNTLGQVKIAGTIMAVGGEYSIELDCRVNRRQFEYHTNSDNTQKVKIVAAFHGFYLGLGTRIIARTKNYKIKSGGWKKFVTSCRAQISGYIVNNDCSGHIAFGTPYKPAKRKRAFKSQRIEFLHFRSIKSGEMVSQHEVGNNSFSIALTW